MYGWGRLAYRSRRALRKGWPLSWGKIYTSALVREREHTTAVSIILSCKILNALKSFSRLLVSVTHGVGVLHTHARRERYQDRWTLDKLPWLHWCPLLLYPVDLGWYQRIERLRPCLSVCQHDRLIELTVQGHVALLPHPGLQSRSHRLSLLLQERIRPWCLHSAIFPIMS
jgi:hypothetical protein